MLTLLRRLLTISLKREKLKRQLEEDGYVVLKKFFSRRMLRRFDQELKDIMKNRQDLGGEITIDILDGPMMAQRLRLREAPDEALQGSIKINDMYLESDACRNLNLNAELRGLLDHLLEASPMVINSLSFTRGSQQPCHFDYYFMPPPVQDQMLVTSICLEDQMPGCGLLSYYPGSHKIPPYRFSNGGIGIIKEELEDATRYTLEEIEKRGLKEDTFSGKAGDVFIWHGSLYHGGQLIEHPDSTRKTLVTHYWRTSDVPPDRVGTTKNGGHYFLREHQEVAAD